jgi:hypothetical protein
VPRYHKFESISLQQRVGRTSVREPEVSGSAEGCTELTVCARGASRCARALRQGRPGKKDRLSQNNDHSGGRCSARTCAADHNRKTGWPQDTSLGLNDQVLALATGKTQQEIAAACKGARPNHVGAAIARYKRAGRIEERDGKLYAT